MKSIKKIILIICLIILPLFTNAQTYEKSVEISNEYMLKPDFKNSYNKYIYIKENNKYGDLITKEEFDITRYNKNKDYRSIGYSYLWDSRPFWSKSKDGDKYISISDEYNSYEKDDEVNTTNIKTKVTEYTKSNVSVYGSGTYTDPWLFTPEYKILIKVKDITKGHITDKEDKSVEKESVELYLTPYSSPEYIYINSKGTNRYIGSTCGYIVNGIDGNKDTNEGNGPYLLVSNVTRDMECEINFGEKPSEIILSQEHTECGKSNPEKIYFTTTTGWYSDEFGNTSINSLTQIPCRIGYTFNGYSNSTNIESACSATKIIDKNGKLDLKVDTLKLLSNKQTLYPCYTPNVYTVSYDVNGGNSLATNSKEVTFDSAYGPLPSPTRTGYIFAGWYTEKEHGLKVTTGTKVTNPSNHTIYARWTPITYSISYNTQEGVLGTKSPKNNLRYDEPLEISFPTRIGYDFAGWNASGNLNTSTAKFGSTKNNVRTNSISSTNTIIKENYLINLTTTNNGSVTLTATWTPRNDTKYVVKHWKQKLNGGTEKNTTNYELVETENLEGTTMTKTSSTVKTYTGYISPSKQESLIAADGSTVINYYYNKSEYTVTISSNNTSYGTVSQNSVVLDYGNTYSTSDNKVIFTNGTTVTANVSTATGYTTNFSSWSSNSGTITGATTLTANFARVAHTYTVKYDCNGGQGSTSESPHTYDVEKGLTENGCSKANYNFTGWNVNADGSGKTYADKAKVKNLTSKDKSTVTLHAQWELADAENPKCTITVSSSGLTLNATDDMGVHSYDLTKSASATYNNNKTQSLSATTFYGYVKDSVGKTGQCSVTLVSTTKGCSKSGYSLCSSGDCCYKSAGTPTKGCSKSGYSLCSSGNCCYKSAGTPTKGCSKSGYTLCSSGSCCYKWAATPTKTVTGGTCNCYTNAGNLWSSYGVSGSSKSACTYGCEDYHGSGYYSTFTAGRYSYSCSAGTINSSNTGCYYYDYNYTYTCANGTINSSNSACYYYDYNYTYTCANGTIDGSNSACYYYDYNYSYSCPSGYSNKVSDSYCYK